MFKKIIFKKECIHCVPDESLIGKRVLYGDTWTSIKEQVESNNWTSRRRTLNSISYDFDYPFVIKDDYKILGRYKFVYYDSEWDEDDEETICYCYLDRDIEPIQFMINYEKPSSHIYAEFTDRDLACKWCYMHDRIAYIAKAWEDGKTIQFLSRQQQLNGEWIDVWYDFAKGEEPKFVEQTEYRVKPTKIYYCYLSKAEPEFIFDKKKPDTHIYAEFTARRSQILIFMLSLLTTMKQLTGAKNTIDMH